MPNTIYYVTSHILLNYHILPHPSYLVLLYTSGVLNATPWIRDDFLKVLASKTPGMSPYMNDDPDSNEREDGIKFENEYY